MAGIDFAGFEQQLLRRGVAPRHVRRTVAELRDHCEDLAQLLAGQGIAGGALQQEVGARLGDLRQLADLVAARPELKCWYMRWPRIARVVYPVAYAAALPLVPVAAGAQHVTTIVRWGTCLLLSAGFTASLLLMMQLSIYL